MEKSPSPIVIWIEASLPNYPARLRRLLITKDLRQNCSLPSSHTIKHKLITQAVFVANELHIQTDSNKLDGN